MYYEIGTIFTITSQPRYWNSRLLNNCPLTSKIKYPYKGKIIEMYIDEEGEIAISDGIYGWSLTTLIQQNLIEIDSNEIRKFKLNKLKKINNV